MSRLVTYISLPGILILFVAGCSSFAKGVTDSILEKKESEKDTRICNAKGYPFYGINGHIARQENHAQNDGLTSTRPAAKVLMIHGIGSPQEGYSTEFITNLNKALKLNRTESRVKELDLIHPKYEGESVGKLTVSRHFNQDSSRELIFYELVWSNIIEKEKKQIEYDNSGKYSYKRANLNHSMKLFFNNHVPDPMIYYGKSREKIILSVNQALCWMFYGDWNDLKSGKRFCDSRTFILHKGVQKDDYSVVTHSLGSRIIIDALQWVAQQAALSKNETFVNKANVVKLLESLRNEEFSIYMLANQLPLLQLGREKPTITNQTTEYCRETGTRWEDRLFKRLNIVAFSDPNDLLSYGIPSQFSRDKMDSRICAKITNIEINVADIVDLFGIGEFANPAEAHNGYSNDEQVIRLIAHGIGHDEVPEKTRENCSWVETVD